MYVRKPGSACFLAQFRTPQIHVVQRIHKGIVGLWGTASSFWRFVANEHSQWRMVSEDVMG